MGQNTSARIMLSIKPIEAARNPDRILLPISTRSFNRQSPIVHAGPAK